MNFSCQLCGSTAYRTFWPTVRDSEDLSVIQCECCGLVQLSSFSHISSTFYRDQKMRVDDTSTVEDILELAAFDDERRYLRHKKEMTGKSVMDFGCGAGGFLRRIKPFCSRVAGVELEQRMISNLLTAGFDVRARLNSFSENDMFDYITLFHVFEHLEQPQEYLCQLKNHMHIGSTLLIEVPNIDDALISLYDSCAFKDFTFWSCHLFSYGAVTLKSMIEKTGYFKVIRIEQVQRYSLLNHCHWLLCGLPGGHQKFSYLDNTTLNNWYAKALAKLGRCDTLVAVVERTV